MTHAALATTTLSKRYGTLHEAHVFCGLSVRALRDMLARRDLTGYRPRPGRVLIDLRELDAVVRRGARRRGTRGRYDRSRRTEATTNETP